MRGLYAIVDVTTLSRKRLPIFEVACAVAAARPAALQLRAKDLAPREVLQLLRAIHPVCREWGVPLFANDRPDLAMLAGCEGVHVGQDELESLRTRWPRSTALLPTNPTTSPSDPYSRHNRNSVRTTWWASTPSPRWWRAHRSRSWPSAASTSTGHARLAAPRTSRRQSPPSCRRASPTMTWNRSPSAREPFTSGSRRRVAPPGLEPGCLSRDGGF
jgi:Thiamine monophosphate synthase